ncbi:PREDICTED: U-box domain-containing protein 14 [Camelina sativa]|uniref:U-box domain-containing protein 14 n=1 Tax=Camelina sativa TaxID=90675 RepID=A0ABM0UWR4_CAMSA|nr:PREDICTED: U-box domain-containing protein 14 [Camelina sativa]XP_010447474.1 PREDICTED: U-box domain-containing protein 14 [Camelina sativa]
MARCHRNNIGSLILDRAPSTSSSSTNTSGNHFRLWSTFSRSKFRRKIVDAVSCGGSSRYRHELRQEEDDKESYVTVTATAKAKSTKANTIGAALNGVPFEERSKKLCDLLNLAEVEADVETKNKEEALEVLKRVVRELQSSAAATAARGDDEEDGGDFRKKLAAASEVRLLAKEDSEARVTLAMLGAIPPLVSMIDDSRIVDAQIASLYALLNLGIGNDANKAAIVKAGAVHKMLKLIESPNTPDQEIAEAVVANFLGLSALDSNKPIIGSSGAVIFLVKTVRNLDETSSSQAREDALRALYNLSIYQPNVSFILETDLITYLLNTLGDMEVSERILAILSNLVAVPEGRKAISLVCDAFPVLVDVLNWTDSPGCQEKATYILMLMAHKGYGDRQIMIEAGIESALLELTLLGSALAQKRASRLLECLRVDKGKQVLDSTGSCGALSAPIYGTRDNGLNHEESDLMMSEERKAVKQLVQQSLQSNMKRIVKRANLPQDFVPSEHFKSLSLSSTSKSLPF